ncbi:HEAT repeat domain-containing protein [Maribacter algarum]|uniref:HEAT repeat domain-containing protein n=1 Tax=Maribacter algarum (ex Zhang et al. 2020) TaxID=2578118 RepID=A0A5S3PVT7_9FLAO|nr:HEAT repeat domain-containing protein [Maribacter algarum]TMM58322.1 HEAT repeat domain-containing protein [Maribacter algarum]
MEQEKFEIWMMEYLSGDLDESRKQEFENYLKNSSKHREEFETVAETWNQIDALEVPEPSKMMDASFFDMLNSEIEKKENKKSNWFVNLKSFFDPIQTPQLAFGMLLLAIGLGIGYFLNSSPFEQNIQETVVSNSTNETEEVREQLVLTLLEQPSANKRLQAVNEAAKLNKANQRIIEALFFTLNKDPNINVRLVAIESLARYVETPEVRMGLVKSIALQDSPLVQIALADLMVKLQEKTSIESMEKLLEKPDINNTVKQKLEQSINQII